MLSGKTVLVTGATGLIGSHLVDVLMQMNDVRVIALSRSEDCLRDVFAPYLRQKRFSYEARNISDPLRLQEDVDVVFHAAGPIGGDAIRNAPLSVIGPNVLGTNNCLELLLQQEKRTGRRGRAVIFSSATVYGEPAVGRTRVDEADTALSEPLEAVTAPYSQSKRMAETLARAYYRQHGVDSRIVRFSYVYGYSRLRPKTAFFDFIEKALAGQDIVMNNADLPKRDNIYIDDAVFGMLTVLEKGESGQAYNVSSDGDAGNFAAMDEMAAEIASVVNERGLGTKEVHVRYRTGAEGAERRPGLLLAHDRLCGLGWNVGYSLRQGVEQTVQALYREKNASDIEMIEGENFMGRFDDKVAVITGATSGIGAACAKEFADEGANVVLVGRNEQRGASLEQKLKTTRGGGN